MRRYTAIYSNSDDGEDESPLRNEADHPDQADLASMQTTQAARDRIESQYGSRFSTLIVIEYFDCVCFHIVDPMHNLFLGTAKHIMKNIWLLDDTNQAYNTQKVSCDDARES